MFKTGESRWGRDPFHAQQDDKTLCGRNSTEWLKFSPGDMTVEDALEDPNLCVRCSKILHPFRHKVKP